MDKIMGVSKNTFVVFLIILFFIFIAILGNLQDSPDNQNTDKKSVPQKIYDIGDKIQVGSFLYQVTDVKTRKSLGNDYIGEKTSGKFLILTIKIDNAGNQTRTIDASMFGFTSEDGADYDSSDRAQMFLGDDSIFLKQAQPGVISEGKLAFEIPSDVGKGYLTLTDGNNPENNQIVKIELP